ncbi:hypothetical protein GCM10017673_25920 [Streptosporangium violaceochromogenes]|nr:hypothetical protein GCM10017673_25920 [Streptosporangium violaceochromogenes]
MAPVVILVIAIGVILGVGLVVWIVTDPLRSVTPAIGDDGGMNPSMMELHPSDPGRTASTDGAAPSLPRALRSGLPPSGGDEEASPGQYTVVFEVVGSAGAGVANIIIGTNYDIKQNSGLPLPYRKEVRTAVIGHLYLWVQNGEGKGAITCRIIVNGKVVREETQAAPYEVCQVSSVEEGF